MTAPRVERPDVTGPRGFTSDPLGWVPWLEPSPAADLSERQVAALVEEARADSPYVRLLADDPDVLEVSTRTDLEIFRSPGGLPRAERELAAVAVSRVNGCVLSASVHARLAARHSRRPAVVERLLALGVDADLGARWNAIVAAAVALTATPTAFGAAHVSRLRGVGLADDEIADLVHAAASVNRDNRLALSLGQPAVA